MRGRAPQVQHIAASRYKSAVNVVAVLRAPILNSFNKYAYAACHHQIYASGRPVMDQQLNYCTALPSSVLMQSICRGCSSHAQKPSNAFITLVSWTVWSSNPCPTSPDCVCDLTASMNRVQHLHSRIKVACWQGGNSSPIMIHG